MPCCRMGIVRSSVAGTFSAEAFNQVEIQDPIQIVFDATVLAEDRVQPCLVGAKACNTRMNFCARFCLSPYGNVRPQCGPTLGKGADSPGPFNRPDQRAPSRSGSPLGVAAVDLLRDRSSSQHTEATFHTDQQMWMIFIHFPHLHGTFIHHLIGEL